MANPGFNYAPLLQLASDMLFVTGASGAVYVDFKLHRTLFRQKALGPAFISRKELHGLVVICLAFTLLIAAAMLLPIICRLNEPGGIRSLVGLRGGVGLVLVWVFNACGSVFGVLWFTRAQYANRVRCGAALAIALTSMMAGLHSYFWMVKPAALPGLIDPQSATGILAAVAVVCAVAVFKWAGNPNVGPLFEWQHLRVRAFGWIVIVANSTLLIVVNSLALRITRFFLPLDLLMYWPTVATLALLGLYYLCRNSIEKSQKMTNAMLRLLVLEVIALWVVLTYVRRA